MPSSAPSNVLPPYLSIPYELHDAIGLYLDLGSITALRLAFRTGYHAYERQQTIIGAKVLNQSLGLEAYARTTRYYHWQYLGKFRKRFFTDPPASKFKMMMQLNGTWEVAKSIYVYGNSAIQFCAHDSKKSEADGDELAGLKVFELILERSLALNFRTYYYREWVNAAVYHARLGCLKLLYQKQLCPEYGSIQASDLLSTIMDKGFGKRMSSLPYNSTRLVLETVKFLICELGAQLQPNRLCGKDHPVPRYNSTIFSRYEQLNYSSGSGYSMQHNRRSADILELFIEHGLDVQRMTYNQRHAVSYSNSAILEVLLNAGLEMDLKAFDVYRPLFHKFCAEYEESILVLLLRKGIHVDTTRCYQLGNITPLLFTILALARNTKSIIKGIKKHIQANGEYQKLIGGDYYLQRNVQLLLRNGANPFLACQSGLTAISVAMTIGNKDLVADMVGLDCRGEERYGVLSPEQLQEKWLEDDGFWTRQLDSAGALQRNELEMVWNATLYRERTECVEALF
ncbi:hypothetical protein BJ508DRAFT_309253 [Ascobolus immersus RN42]|uniref:Ankyrin n=1 Tax=Ascobolus immersus RN42 TaxID=1160509 RepID=A0A3N4I9M9_ASCIM|nr:hypothetical protein BJ508DRAFT_309253 [Ascobolus immersus RN42]